MPDPSTNLGKLGAAMRKRVEANQIKQVGETMSIREIAA
jgi:hypothetical protein